MGLNIGYIKSLVGILKIISIVILIMTFSAGMDAYLNSDFNQFDKSNSTPTARPINRTTTTPNSLRQEVIILSSTTVSSSTTEKEVKELPILWMERFHLITTGFCIMISIVYFIAYLVNLVEKPVARGIDFGYHFFGALFLIVSSIFMMYSGWKIDSLSDQVCRGMESCQLYKEKLSAAGGSFVAAVLFLAICTKSFGKKLYQTV